MLLKGKVAIVTGAGSGIGKEIALTFARDGARVGINDITADKIENTLKQIKDMGGEGIGLKADVASSGQVKDMFARLLGKFGTLDILVNNAGISGFNPGVRERCNRAAEQRMAGRVCDFSLGATRNLTDEAWHRMLEVHLSGTFYCTREALAIMEDNGHGKIINIASICGIAGCPPAPDYSAAKGGIIAFTKAVAAEVIGRGIHVNCIAPGFIDTALAGEMGPSKTGKIMGMPLSLAIPMGHLGNVAEVASLALYLASDQSSYMVGQVISPNGGQVI